MTKYYLDWQTKVIIGIVIGICFISLFVVIITQYSKARRNLPFPAIFYYHSDDGYSNNVIPYVVQFQNIEMCDIKLILCNQKYREKGYTNLPLLELKNGSVVKSDIGIARFLEAQK